MFPKFCGIKYLWTILWQDKGNLFRRGHTFDGILHWMPQCGGKYGMLWFLSTLMFLYCRQLKVLTPQIWRHHVFRFTFYNMSNFMFSERTYFDGTPTSKIWLCGTEKTEKATSKFLPGGGYSTLSSVRMCGPKFRPPPYNKTREDANLQPISKPFVSWRALS